MLFSFGSNCGTKYCSKKKWALNFQLFDGMISQQRFFNTQNIPHNLSHFCLLWFWAVLWAVYGNNCICFLHSTRIATGRSASSLSGGKKNPSVSATRVPCTISGQVSMSCSTVQELLSYSSVHKNTYAAVRKWPSWSITVGVHKFHPIVHTPLFLWSNPIRSWNCWSFHRWYFVWTKIPVITLSPPATVGSK